MKIFGMKTHRIVLAIFLSTLVGCSSRKHAHKRILESAPKSITEVSTGELTCNQEMMTSYGFEGLSTPSKEINKFCPNMTNNCCSEEDVDLSIKLWHNDSMRKIEAYYETYLYSLKYVLGFAYEVNLLAEEFLESDRSTCKHAANEFKTLNINREIAKEIFRTFVESLEKISEARRGFYCVLCDATTQSRLKDYWAITNVFYQDRMYYNQEFCKELVEHTIRAAYYEIFYLKRYSELTTTLMSCRMGQKSIKEIEYEVPYWNSQQIKNCYYFKNKYFFFFCENYCEKFHLTKANSNFDGNLDQIQKFVKFIAEHREDAFYSPSDNFLMGWLSGKEDYMKENFEEFNSNDSNRIFFKSVTSQVQLENFETDVLVEGGFNPFDSAKGSLYPITLASVWVSKVTGLMVLMAFWFK